MLTLHALPSMGKTTLMNRLNRLSDRRVVFDTDDLMTQVIRPSMHPSEWFTLDVHQRTYYASRMRIHAMERGARILVTNLWNMRANITFGMLPSDYLQRRAVYHGSVDAVPAQEARWAADWSKSHDLIASRAVLVDESVFLDDLAFFHSTLISAGVHALKMLPPGSYRYDRQAQMLQPLHKEVK